MVDIKNFPNSISLKGILSPSGRWSFLENYNILGNIELVEVEKISEKDGEIFYKGKGIIREGEADEEHLIISVKEESKLNSFKLIRNRLNALPEVSFVTIEDISECFTAVIEDENSGYLQDSIEGKMTIGNLDPVKFSAFKFDELLNIALSFPSGQAPDILDISPIIGNKNDLNAEWLPEELKGVVAITSLSMSVETTTAVINNVNAQFSIANQRIWNIVPGVEWLQIGNLWGNLVLDYPLQSDERSARIGFGGSLFLGPSGKQAEIKIDTQWPDLAISGSLKDGDVIPLGYLLTEMGLPVAGPNAGDDLLMISELNFAAEPLMTEKSFSFGLTINNVWKLNLNGKALFELHSISADLSYQQLPNSESNLEGSMTASMSIEDYKLTTSINYDDNGWQIKAWSDDELNINNLVNRLLSTAHLKFSLPDGLSDLRLTSVEVSYHTGSGEFEIKGAFRNVWEITHGPKIKDVEFLLGYTPDNGFKAAFNGGVMLEGIGTNGTDIELGIEFKYEDGGWYLDGSTDIDSGDSIKLNQVARKIAGRENDDSFTLPESLNGLSVQNLGVHFQKEGTQNQFSTTATVLANDFPFHGQNTSLTLDLELSSGEEEKELSIRGEMTLVDQASKEPHVFTVAFAKGEGVKAVLVTYKGNLPLYKVISLFENSSDGNKVSEIIPNWMSPTMTGASFLIMIGSKDKPSSVIFNLKGGLNFNLKDMHLVGEYLGDRNIDVDMDMTIVSQNIGAEDAHKLGKAIEELQEDVAEDDRIKINGEEGHKKGFSVAIKLEGPGIEDLITDESGRSFEFNQELGSDEKSEETQQVAQKEPKTKWSDSKKQFGPVFINKLGVTLEDGKFSLLIDGGLSMGGFTFSLLGLGVKIPLQTPVKIEGIEFGLEGLALNYTNGDLRIAGGFMAQKVEYEGQICSGYFGEVLLKIGDKTFKAIGCYIHPDKGMVNASGQQLQPSFFLFAVANIPIGGPAFFYITGFAAGFGINSSLNIPSIDKLKDFILLKIAFDETSFDESDPGTNIQIMQKDIIPQLDSYWVAVGLKATHFVIIESFFLVTVEFGKNLEINLLGLMKLNLPPPGNKIVKAELAVRARFLPNQGILTIDGAISPGSYLLDPSVKLSGGFAFYTWFMDYKSISAGDFVFSMGGYHPKYKPPSHYPKVPRIGINWQLSNLISIKGEMYFAVTPNVLMVGGRLDARADLGMIQAWFIAEAHFLVNFSPLHYSAVMSVNMGVRFTLDLLFVTITTTISFSVRVELWGPDFGGLANIDLAIIQFELSFGAPKSPPPPLTWDEFQKQFLPAADSTVVSSVNTGLIKDLKGNPEFGDYDWILNPTEMELNLESVVPLTVCQDKIIEEANLGILSMDLEKGQFVSDLKVEISYNGKTGFEDKFNVKLADRVNVPIAMWGGKADRKGQLKAKETLIKQQVQKIKITPRPPEVQPDTTIRNIEDLNFAEPKDHETKVTWFDMPEGDSFDPEIENSISGADENTIQLLQSAFGLTQLDAEQWHVSDEDRLMMESDIKIVPTGVAR